MRVRLRPGRLLIGAIVAFALFCAATAPASRSAESTLEGRGGELVSSVISVGPSALPSGEVNASYSTKLTASGGSAPYTYTVTGGSLPAGLTLASSGTISGTPTATGTSSFVVSATDPDHFSGSASISVTINAGPTIDTTSLGEVTVATPYSIDLEASSGTAPYSWSIATGPIPGGLVLSSLGVLSGIPRTAGTYDVDLKVTDALGSSASATVSLLVEPLPPPEQEVAVLTSTGVELYLDGEQVGSVPSTAGDVATVMAPNGGGGWAVSASGRVVGFGTKKSLGSVGAGHLLGRIVAIAAAPSGRGYWLVSSTGHVYGFGSAKSKGFLRRRAFRGQVVAMAASPVGAGYWLLTSTGKVYAFGSAHNYGSPDLAHRSGHVVGISPGPSGAGYWVAMSTGVVFGKGPACQGGVHHRAAPVVAMASAPNGTGYWLLSRHGAVTTVGTARRFGPLELGNRALARGLDAAS